MSPGCKACYAERDFDLRKHFVEWGPNGTRIVTSPDNWSKPPKWDEAAYKAGVIRKVFCASLSDIFEQWTHVMRGKVFKRGKFSHDEVYRIDADGYFYIFNEERRPRKLKNPTRALTYNDVRIRLVDLIRQTPFLRWQLLTKRIENVMPMLTEMAGAIKNLYIGRDDTFFDSPSDLHTLIENWRAGTPPETVWIGTSIENGEWAEKRHKHLMKVPAVVRFWSVEPLLGGFDPIPLWNEHGAPDWIILGGESGPVQEARECQIEWFDTIMDAARAWGVPVFVKQMGTNPSLGEDDKGRIPLELLHHKGEAPSEWPERFRVQQFPLGHEAVSAV